MKNFVIAALAGVGVSAQYQSFKVNEDGSDIVRYFQS